MPFVVNASVAATWLLPDEGNPVADVAYQRLLADYALVVSNERRGRIGNEQTARAMMLLTGLPIQLDHAPDSTVLIALARMHRHTAYDAAYLELGMREAIALATLDDALRKAALTEGVPLI